MIQASGKNGNQNAGTVQEPTKPEPNIGPPLPATVPIEGQEPATRAKQRAKQTFRQNRFVIFVTGAVVAALMIYVAMSMPGRRAGQKSTGTSSTARNTLPETGPTPGDKSLFPITDSGRPTAKEMRDGFLNEQDLDRTATGRRTSTIPGAGQANAAGTLGSIPPFGEQNWQAAPYQPGTANNNAAEIADAGKAEREAMEKPSLVYVRSVSAVQGSSRSEEAYAGPEPEIGLGLATGTRLRARLESAASTAVRTPVLAVIEYNYERNGEIIVPAGAKALGRLQDADRSGYVRVEFDSMLMPDGSEVPIQAVATDLEMRPLKGKVEGKNAGKNVLVRSLSGIGEIGAMLVGRGNLDQPLSESDLLRERVGNNIGEAGDEQISRIAVTQRIVVTINANTPIYVVLEKAPKSSARARTTSPTTETGTSTNAEDLRQLLQLQRELNQSSATNR